MSNALDQLLSLHAEIEQGLDVQLKSIASREAEAHRLMAQCFEERQRIDRERAGLKEAEQIYRDAFGFSTNAPQAERTQTAPRSPTTRPAPQSESASTLMSDAHLLNQRQVRARIGPQRFLMLDAINTMVHLGLENIATLTKLPYRRVKDQMVSDVRAGMVLQSDDLYSLTSAGMDLLSRFKAYKRAHGQALPTADDAHDEDDRDDTETQDQSIEGAVQTAMQHEKLDVENTLKNYSIADEDGRIKDGVA